MSGMLADLDATNNKGHIRDQRSANSTSRHPSWESTPMPKIQAQIPVGGSAVVGTTRAGLHRPEAADDSYCTWHVVGERGSWRLIGLLGTCLHLGRCAKLAKTNKDMPPPKALGRLTHLAIVQMTVGDASLYPCASEMRPYISPLHLAYSTARSGRHRPGIITEMDQWASIPHPSHISNTYDGHVRPDSAVRT